MSSTLFACHSPYRDGAQRLLLFLPAQRPAVHGGLERLLRLRIRAADPLGRRRDRAADAAAQADTRRMRPLDAGNGGDLVDQIEGRVGAENRVGKELASKIDTRHWEHYYRRNGGNGIRDGATEVESANFLAFSAVVVRYRWRATSLT